MQTSQAPIVVISSHPPRLCRVASFCEEAREFLQKANPEREVLVISHTDGAGNGVLPIMDLERRDWWKVVVQTVAGLAPHAVHIQHDYPLYEHVDERGRGDDNAGFLDLLDALADWPTVVELHTVHGRLSDAEADFVYNVCRRADVVILKCHYQKWRLEWSFPQRDWPVPQNVAVVPHGARPDRRWGVEDVPRLRSELGLDDVPGLARHLVGLIGWIQARKRWDILTRMWEQVSAEIREATGERWDLLAAGAVRDAGSRQEAERWKGELRFLERKGLAHYYEFIPRGERYYKMMAVCDFIVLPSIDETQSGTLASVIALNKPFVTIAPLEGLTAQALESEGGLLFTTKEALRRQVIRLATDEDLRMTLGGNLHRYLNKVVSWEVVSRQYNGLYETARAARERGETVSLPTEF